MALGEIGHRARLFPLLLNVFDKYPVVAQNYQTARKMLDAARNFKYEIFKYTTEFAAPKTIEEIHQKVLKFSRDAPEPFENLKYQFSISRILPIVIFDAFSAEKVIFQEIAKTIHGPIGSSCINQNYVQMAWPNKWNRILARKSKPTPQTQDRNDSGVSGVSGISDF